MGRVRPYDTGEVLRDDMTGVEVEPVFCRQRCDFKAEAANGDELRAERLPDLHRKLRDALRRGWGLRWSRAIVFELPRSVTWPSVVVPREGVRVEAGLGFARGEVATRASDGRTLFRGWPPEDFDEDLPANLNPPDLRTVVLLEPGARVAPYTDAGWKAARSALLAFARVREALEGAADLDAIVRAADLRALLQDVRAAERAAEAARRAE